MRWSLVFVSQEFSEGNYEKMYRDINSKLHEINPSIEKYNYLLDISKNAVEDENLYNITNASASESTEEYQEYIKHRQFVRLQLFAFRVDRLFVWA